jgi:hypothetical protein
MTKGQLSRKASRRQAQVENPMALLAGMLAMLEHDSLRVRQAIRRTGLHDLLAPVLEDHRVMACNIRAIQSYLRDLWEDGQDDRWGC